ncbi:hypothetical protein [Campylobacter sp. US33a]|uniref:hypothetical protein n=1 Tax=Campylobacter sp. US33a TaxID=2498120 RepID=UPI0010671EAB|nr:hypothetical protein [Campylobacter sp. US33a]TEY04038.1 hypothetical protein ELQ16_02020 [Campylobacter sp. US33a]
MVSFQNLLLILQGKVEVVSLMPYKDKIEALSDEKITQIQFLNFKNPIIGLLLGLIPAWILCGLSLDRLYKGDIFLGIMKIVFWILSFVWIFIAIAIKIAAFDELDYSDDMQAVMTLFVAFLGFFVLFIWNLVDFFLVWQGIKKDNLKKIVNFLEQN